ncbi:GGDEF domain-containing protein [Deinococcus multiflagellatus]|uniref:GGDEF domain-containing protein n=2 Tax=Deinococcus multiflagellatus TaxID=1656887 RepID=A0ABW1ZSL9_9DEIO
MSLPTRSPRHQLQRALCPLLTALPLATLLLGLVGGAATNVAQAGAFLALLGLTALLNHRWCGWGSALFLLVMPLWLVWFVQAPGFGATFLPGVTGYGAVLILLSAFCAVWFPVRGVAVFVLYGAAVAALGFPRSPLDWLGMVWFLLVALLVGFALAWLLGCADQMVRQLGSAARRDPLTGLGNRRAFEEALRAAWTRHPGTLALALIDVDGLKTVNDERGHAAGDQVLQLFAQGLQTHLPATHGLYRIGGDEYVALCTRRGVDALHRAIEAATAQVRQQGFPLVGASVGVACSTETAAPETLLTLADGRMYRDKHRKYPARSRPRTRGPWEEQAATLG